MEGTDDETEKMRKGGGLPSIVSSQPLIENCINEKDQTGKLYRVKNPSWVHVWPQVLASCIALSLTIQAGISLAFPAVLNPQLEDEFSSMNFTRNEASWIASLSAIATPIGAIISGPMMESLGRKKVCILTNVPIILSWILVYITKYSLMPMYVSRVLAGLGSGMSTAALVYTAEISHMLYRPMLLCLNSVFVAFGIMVTNVLGVNMEWRKLAIAFGLLATASGSLCLILPESPYWLVNFKPSRARTALALQELRKLNRPSWLYEQESQRLKESLQARVEECDTTGSSENKSIVSRIQYITKVCCARSITAPFFLLIGLFLLQQLSGVYVIIVFSVKIFKGLGGELGKGIDEFTGTAVLGILRFIMSLLTAVLSRIYGRRVLMVTSSIGMGISCLVAGILLTISPPSIDVLSSSNITYYSDSPFTDTSQNFSEYDNYNLNHLAALIALLIFVCAGALGHLVIPWTLIGELLPTKARALGSGLLISYAYIIMFITVKSFLFLTDYFNLSSIFYFSSTVSFVSAVYIYIFLPETFGRTFTEIAKSFEKKNLNR